MQTSSTVRIPTIRLLRVFALALSALLLLSACGPSDAEKQAQADAEAATRAAVKARLAKQTAAADPTSNMAHAVVVGKSQSVMDLKYDIAKKPMVGEPIEIELAFIPTYDGDSISATITSMSAGLVLEGNLTPSTSGTKAGATWNITLTARAAEPIAYYFNVGVDHSAAGVRSTRNFAIPLFVSAATATATAAAGSSESAAGSNGEAVDAAAKTQKK